mgnify:CR=1 FL=1
MNSIQKGTKKSITGHLLAAPYVVWAAGFIVLPLLMVMFYGLTKKSDGSFTLENLKLIIAPVNRQILWLSIKLSLISTGICLLIAYPLALALRSLKMKSNSFVILIFMLPMWMNFLLRTIAWQNILEKNGVLNQLLTFLHLPTVNIINTPVAIVLGMVYDYLPFMIIPVYNVLAKIDDNVIQAARDLGANYFQTLCKVIIPLSIPGVISGVTMVFIPSLTTFVISDVLGGSKVILIGKVIEQQFKMLNNWNAGCGMSLVLMIFIFICMAVMQKYDKNAEGTNVW